MKKFVLLSLIGIFFVILSFTAVMSTQITLKEGEEQKVTIGGTEYTIGLAGVSSETSAVVSVNGVAKSCNKNETYKISGLDVKIVYIYYSKESQVSSAILDISQSVTQENKTCVDSDGGLNYYVKGTVTVCTFNEQSTGCGAATDFCNGNVLTEGFCKGTDSNSLTYTCPYGCSDGTCIQQSLTTTIPGQCVNHAQCSQACDYLGTDKWQSSRKWQGTCPQGVYGCMTGDCCLGQCRTKTGECYCLHTNIVDIYGNVCPSGTTCGEDCRCHSNTVTTIPTTTCTDSDGGKNYYTKGTVTKGTAVSSDCCAVSKYNPDCILSSDYLAERFCDSQDDLNTEIIYCPNSCKDGACIQETLTTVPNNGISLIDVYCKDLTIVATLRNDDNDTIYTSSLKFYVNGILDSNPNCDKDSIGINPGETTVCNKLEGSRSYNELVIVGPSNSIKGSVYCGMETTTTIPELNVQIISPRDGQTVSGKVTVIVNANGYNELGDMTLSVQKEEDTTAMVIPLTSCGGGLACPTTVGGRCQYSKSCTYDWDTSSYKGSVLLTATISDFRGNRATDTTKVYVMSSNNLIINILSPRDGQKISGKVTIEASAESQYQLGDMSLSIEKRQSTGTGGSGSGVTVNFTDCYPAGVCNSLGCFYHVNCRYIWNTENYDGEVFLTTSITDKMNNKGTDSVNIYVSNYQTCSDQCESMGYRYGSCETGCNVDEINIGSNGCPQVACAPCISGQPCPVCPVYSCCCSKKTSCPYDCCANDPNYPDKPCQITTCPICEPGKECPPCIQPKCIDHRCVWYPQEEFLLNFKEGWNVFSFPVDIRSYLSTVSQPVQQITIQKTITGKVTEIEPIPSEKQCTSPNHVWHYSNGKYIDVLNDPNGFVNGWGYWVKMDSDCIVRLKGNKITINDFPELQAGWNQIGSPSDSVNFFSVIGSCNVLSGPWWFNSASDKYEKTQVLRPGEGYFIRVKDKCKLGSEIPPLPPEELSIISKALKIK